MKTSSQVPGDLAQSVPLDSGNAEVSLGVSHRDTVVNRAGRVPEAITAAQAVYAAALERNDPDALCRAAIELIKRGVPVFPCKANKAPGIADGFRGASDDPDLIVRQWRFLWRLKGACIGMPTGGGLFVLDIDPDSGGTVDERLLDADRTPATFTVRTPRGGWHMYYATDQPIPCSAGRIAPGVDVRCDGGYVVVIGAGREVVA